MELWNVKSLPPPPTDRCQTGIKEIDITFLKNVLQEARNFFDKQQQFTAEAAVLSRCVYRMKLKFRSSKDFKAVEKLNRALLCYLEVDIRNVLTKFMYMFPKTYKIYVTYLPTKNLMDYLLVRLQGFGKVLCRILDTCQIASLLMQQRIHLGHFWKIALIIFSMISRIYALTKNMVKFTCNLYANLLPFSSKLKNNGPNWLPDDYQFPDNLDEWLAIDWLEMDNTIIEIPDDEQVSFFNLVEDSDDDIEFCDEYVLVNDKSDDDDSVMLVDEENLKTLRGFESNVDTGEEIPQTPPKRLNLINLIIDFNKKNNILKSQNSKSKQSDNKNIIDLENSDEESKVIELTTPRKKKIKLKRKFNPDRSINNVNNDSSVVCIDENPPKKLTKKNTTPKQTNTQSKKNRKIKNAQLMKRIKNKKKYQR